MQSSEAGSLTLASGGRCAIGTAVPIAHLPPEARVRLPASEDCMTSTGSRFTISPCSAASWIAYPFAHSLGSTLDTTFDNRISLPMNLFKGQKGIT